MYCVWNLGLRIVLNIKHPIVGREAFENILYAPVGHTFGMFKKKKANILVRVRRLRNVTDLLVRNFKRYPRMFWMFIDGIFETRIS